MQIASTLYRSFMTIVNLALIYGYTFSLLTFFRTTKGFGGTPHPPRPIVGMYGILIVFLLAWFIYLTTKGWLSSGIKTRIAVGVLSIAILPPLCFLYAFQNF